MKEEDIILKAKKVINDILYITLATCDKNNQPWNSPVYCAFDENYNFYWGSWTKNQHSKNIKENGNVFAVIYNSTPPDGKGFGVYMKGKAHQLEKKDIVEIVKSLKLIYSRKNKEPRKPEEFLGLLPKRVYKFVPEQVWVNSDEYIKDSKVDTRIDITNDLLNK